VFHQRRVVIITDVAATLVIFPVPTLALVLRRTFELLLSDGGAVPPKAGVILEGYPLKAGQLTYDCRYSTMHGMPVTGGRGFRGLKPLWYNGVPP